MYILLRRIYRASWAARRAFTPKCIFFLVGWELRLLGEWGGGCRVGERSLEFFGERLSMVQWEAGMSDNGSIGGRGEKSLSSV